MIFITRPLNLTMNQSPQPLEFFLRHTEPLSRNTRETCFIRYIGMKSDDAAYIAAIKKMDAHFGAADSQTPYMRLDHLKKITDPEQICMFSQQYDTWIQLKNSPPQARFEHHFPVKLPNDVLEWTQKQAFQSVLHIFAKNEPTATPSMIRNFGIKLFGWTATYLPLLFNPAPPKHNFPKVVFIGKIKRHEQLFLYFLALLGCDILYMNAAQDMEALYAEIAAVSSLQQAEFFHASALPIPAFAPPARLEISTERPATPPKSVAASHCGIDVSRPQKNPGKTTTTGELPELSYEELAKRANSVVMIKVYDDTAKAFKSGSGVVIHSSGYILTNFHVVCNGSGFSVQFENEEQEYRTQDLIKYHPDYDLAIIKVGKSCTPIALHKGDPLVRGQKVVAIGSPLGLFNTVSDGIISGFRKVDKKSMVQFTAPISSGSSGGALLDIRGRLVGLITANFDDGQNLNLAVNHQTIQVFAQNFM